MRACVNGALAQIEIEWDDGAAVCVIIASGGYPGKVEDGFVINGLDSVGNEAVVFHAGTKFEGNQVVTAGGRVLGVTGTGASIEEAAKAAYNSVDKIEFTDSRYRTDIGKKIR
jgi:phosphoribosylamine--glycine ligase